MHAHACGEFVLEQLQNGAKPADVAQQLLSKYLIQTTAQRVLAYRHYREQQGQYWTAELLERLHWAVLYTHISLEKHFGSSNSIAHTVRKKVLLNLTAVRVSLCHRLGTSEELVPLNQLGVFFAKHQVHAAPWVPLGPPWGPLVSPLGLGFSWVPLGPSFGSSPFSRFGSFLWIPLGPLWFPLGPLGAPW